MKVLFVSSGRAGDVGHVVKNQGESLKKVGTEVEYLTIKPGIIGYLKAVGRIRGACRRNSYDLVHAHYSLSAFSATLAGVRPLVVSVMGSDAYASWPFRVIIRMLSACRWDATIVKTEQMKGILKLKKAVVIPNGVDTERFAPSDMVEARQKLNLPADRQIVLFIGAADRPEKNLKAAEQAVAELRDSSVLFIHLANIPNSDVPHYLNAADLLLLTSLREGSVNVIKEAMACNCPIVSTDVGDVKWVTGNTEGCFITSFSIDNIMRTIRMALNFGRRTNGRGKIHSLDLDSLVVSEKILSLYRGVLTKSTSDGNID